MQNRLQSYVRANAWQLGALVVLLALWLLQAGFNR